MKIEKVYKVTTTDCCSCAKSFENFIPDLILTYSTKHFTLPNYPKSAIFCFKTLDKVAKFLKANLKSSSGWIVWEAEAFNVRPKLAIIKVTSNFKEKFYSFWGGIIGRIGIRMRPLEKYGFYVCDGLKLTKLVDKNEIIF